MSTLLMDPPISAWLKHETSTDFCRDAVTVLEGQNLKSGAVVGRANVGVITPTAFAGNTGTGSIGTVTAGAGCRPGDYKLVIVKAASNAGTFDIFDPDGVQIGRGTVAVAYAGQLAFTLADATDFVVGDGFTISVAAAAGGGKVKAWNPTNTDGSAVVAGILLLDVDATASDLPGAIVARDAHVVERELRWFSGATTDQKAAGMAGLAALRIFPRLPA